MKRRKHFPHSLGLSTPLNAFLSEVGIDSVNKKRVEMEFRVEFVHLNLSSDQFF